MGFCSQGVNAFSFGAVMHPGSPRTEASGASQTSASETLHQAVRLYPLAHPLFIVIIIMIFVFCLFRAAPAAHGGSKARGLIGAIATSLRQSHSNAGSKLRLQPTPQFTAMPDPQPTEQGQGSNLQPHGS